ncbi:MAG: 50S ribosomal protein L30 [Polyangiaceae bacterium]|nr:50S ribosomal protein L30 [Polyangiaceae bacterium]MCW5792202.1 50S ribosomal protein L30 [Polyangiaceae bacterium]
MSRLVVRQVASVINRPNKQRLVLKGLGLGRIGKVVEVDDTPSFRGMIKQVIHLVQVEEKQS